MFHLLAVLVVVLLVGLVAVGVSTYLLYRVLYQADVKPAKR